MKAPKPIEITYFDFAKSVANLSKATRLKVGCVFVKRGNIIAFGYNGTPSGFPNDCEIDGRSTRPEVIHAEENCLLKCLETSSPFGCSVYSTHSPCPHCAALMVQAGIREVFYLERFRDDEGIKILHRGGVECHFVDY